MSDHPTLPFDEAEPPEEWRPVAGYEGLYDVSDQGRVRSHHRSGPGKRGGVLAPHSIGKKRAYLAVDLSKSGIQETRLIHQLVAEAFIGPRPDGCEVRHGPGGARDNRLCNLSYGTHVQNCEDMHRDGTMRIGEANSKAKLTAEKVREIRARHEEGWPIRRLAPAYGVSRRNIGFIVRRLTWKHVA